MNIYPPQVIASTDSPAYFSRAANTIAGVSATCADADAQISVSVAGGTAVTFPVGTGYSNAAPEGQLIQQSLLITVLAGSVTFSTKT